MEARAARAMGRKLPASRRWRTPVGFTVSGFALLAAALTGCGGPPEPFTEACVRIFQTRVHPEAVISWTTDTDPERVRVLYWLEDEISPADRGVFECGLRRAKTGGIRIASVTHNGIRLSETWASVANADLVLADLQRYAARDPDRP